MPRIEISLLLSLSLWFDIFSIMCYSLIVNREIIHPTNNSNSSARIRRFSRDITPDSPEIHYMPTYFHQSEMGISDLPNEILQIHMNQNALSVLCIAPHNSERVTWTKYDCPNQINSNEPGQLIASDALVTNPSSYAVHFIRRSGRTVSELVLKHPLLLPNDGIYVCESFITNEDYSYFPFYKMRDIFIIGGTNFMDKCYNQKSNP